MDLYGTRIADDATIKTVFVMDKFPDTNGKNGLFICNKTRNIN